MEERTFPPRLGGRTFASRLISRDWVFELLVAMPGEDAALIDGIERGDDGDGARDRKSRFAAAPAEAVEQHDLVVSGKAAIDDPVVDALDAFRRYRHLDVAAPHMCHPGRKGMRLAASLIKHGSDGL